MKRLLQLTCIVLAASLVGCAVHDGHEDEPAPIWWPTFLYRPTTHPTTEEYDMTRGNEPAVVDGSAMASARDVRAEWNAVYSEYLATPTGSPDNLADPVQPESPAAATLYPNRGQAALAANSATLYPPTNEFNGGPAHTASVYSHGPLAPTGYLGR